MALLKASTVAVSLTQQVQYQPHGRFPSDTGKFGKLPPPLFPVKLKDIVDSCLSFL